jgi:hypothetical protein
MSCPQINNTTIKGTSAVTYDSTPLPCTDVNTCDGLNVILSKFDSVICNIAADVATLTEDITNATEDLMIIIDDVININDQLDICCTTTTSTTLPVTTTTTSSSSSTTSTSTTATPTTTTTSTSSTSTTTSTTTAAPSTTTTSSSSTSTTTTSTTAPVYTYAGTVVNNTGNAITASTALIRVNGTPVAFVTLNIAPGATQTFSTTYSIPVLGIGNNFTLELYAYTGVTTSNTMNQAGGTCVTSTGNFVNMGSYLIATSSTTGPTSCSVYVIAMTIE